MVYAYGRLRSYRMKRIYSARDEVDAELVKNLLAERGVESVVQSEGLTAILGTLSSAADAAPGLWVQAEDEEKAIAALADIKDGAAPKPESDIPWKCFNCGEEIEPQFTECWNCGTQKPEPT